MMNKQSIKWNEEYLKKGIPSSIRPNPSGSVRYLDEFLTVIGINNGQLIDIGCGSGRNSMFFAQKGFTVNAIDFVEAQISRLKHAVESEEYGRNINALCHDITTPWPYENSFFDVAIDTFVFKHQIEQKEKQAYKNELARTLSSNGYYLLTLSGVEDGYYGPLLAHSSNVGRNVILDPENGIESTLYNVNDVLDEFSDLFSLVRYEHKSMVSEMHGGEYKRSTHLFIFRKI